VLLTQAIHQLDALLTFAGMPARVHAHWFRTNHTAEVEDEVIASLEWHNGARGTLTASQNDPAGYEVIEVHGDTGAVRVRGYEVERTTYASAQRTTRDCPEEYPDVQVQWEPLAIERKPSEWFDMMLDCHRDFVSAIASGRPPSIAPAEGTRIVEFVNALYASAARNTPVCLPLEAADFERCYARLCEGSLAVPERAGK
jgi:predicted dehydrogenase